MSKRARKCIKCNKLLPEDKMFQVEDTGFFAGLMGNPGMKYVCKECLK